jgi:hypothetical protein
LTYLDGGGRRAARSGQGGVQLAPIAQAIGAQRVQAIDVQAPSFPGRLCHSAEAETQDAGLEAPRGASTDPQRRALARFSSPDDAEWPGQAKAAQRASERLYHSRVKAVLI